MGHCDHLYDDIKPFRKYFSPMQLINKQKGYKRWWWRCKLWREISEASEINYSIYCKVKISCSRNFGYQAKKFDRIYSLLVWVIFLNSHQVLIGWLAARLEAMDFDGFHVYTMSVVLYLWDNMPSIIVHITY